jgi:hypothetical protein
MRTALTAVVLTLMPLPSSAQSCYQWGNQTTCDNGATINRYGNENAILGSGSVGTTTNGSAPPASPQGCYQWGNQAACNNGLTINRYGNENVPSGSRPTDGSSSVGTSTNQNNTPSALNSNNGNIAGVPNGVTYRMQGNTLYLSDGTTATIQGDTTTFSNGRTCQRYGSSAVCR